MAKHDDEKDSRLSNAFKKLKVETEIDAQQWASLPVADRQLDNPTNEEDKPRLKSPAKCFTHRPLPYSKDKLSTGLPDLSKFEQLSFAKESCNNVRCKCNHQTDTDNKCTQDIFTKAKHHLNFAQACSDNSTTVNLSSSPKKVLKEARLKLHHKHKDHKVVLRAARLRLANTSAKDRDKKKSVTSFCALSTPQSPKLGHVTKDAIFGSGGKAKTLEDFQSVHEGQTCATACDDKKQPLPDKYDFSGAFRNRDSTAEKKQQKEAFDLHSLLGTLEVGEEETVKESSRPNKGPCPLHPGKCSKPCSCSHQARLDDWSEEELACYFEEFVHIPKKMSMMAEMMYT